MSVHQGVRGTGSRRAGVSLWNRSANSAEITDEFLETNIGYTSACVWCHALFVDCR